MVVKRTQSPLEAGIAQALATRMQPGSGTGAERSGKWLLLAGAALAILQIPPAAALTLGELQVKSALGEPLVATTTVRLGAGETLSPQCLSAPAGSGGDIARPSGVNVATVAATGPGEFPVRLSTRAPLYEPMYEIQLQVQCTGSIALRKNYTVLLNLPATSLSSQAQASNTAPPPAAARPTPRPSAAAPRGAATPSRQPVPQARNLQPSGAPIAAGSLYRVRSGDSLSTVAERVTDRPAGSLWKVAELLFTANPDAFVRGDRDLLKLGSVLYIPAADTLALDTAGMPAERPSRSDAPATATLPAPVPARQPVTTPAVAPQLLATESDAPTAAASEPAAARSAAPATPPATTAPLAIAAAPVAATQAAPKPQAPPARPLAAAESAGDATVAGPSDPPAPQTRPAEVNPIIAVLAGMLLGAFLAMAILGRSLLSSLLGGRRRAAAVPAAAAAGYEPVTAATPHDTQRLQRVPADPLSYTRAGIDVELTPAGDTCVDLDLSHGLQPFDDNSTTALHPPRVNLHDRDNEFANMLDELAATGEVSALYAKPETETANSTIRDLFSEFEASQDGDTDPTSRLPDSSAATTAKQRHMNTDELAAQDLQSLSKRLTDTSDDERLSATLTQALQLLEKDYEDELSTSQRLSRDDIDAAFAKQAGKSG